MNLENKEEKKEPTKEEKKAESNSLYAEYKAKQSQYRKKTEANSFKNVKMEKISKKDRESETMAMLTGFKGALFTARNPKAAKEKAEKEKGSYFSGFREYLWFRMHCGLSVLVLIYSN